MIDKLKRGVVGVAGILVLQACDKPAPPAQVSAPPPAPTAQAPAVAPPPVPPAAVPAAPVAVAPAPAGVPKTAPNAPVVTGNVALTPAPKAAPVTPPAAAIASVGKVPANFIGAIGVIPADWRPVAPANSMRVAQYAVPPVGGAEPAELVVFYFAAGRGGSQDENIGRWASQFTDASGAKVKPTIRRGEVNGMAVTRVDLAGSYSRGVGVGTSGDVRPDQALMAAITMTPMQANVTLHLYGPKAVVEHHRAAFDEVVASLRPSGH